MGKQTKEGKPPLFQYIPSDDSSSNSERLEFSKAAMRVPMQSWNWMHACQLLWSLPRFHFLLVSSPPLPFCFLSAPKPCFLCFLSPSLPLSFYCPSIFRHLMRIKYYLHISLALLARFFSPQLLQCASHLHFWSKQICIYAPKTLMDKQIKDYMAN